MTAEGPPDEQDTNIFSLTRSLVAAQREAAARVAAGRRFSVRVPLVGAVQVPPPDQLAFYGVLAGLAALELIDWPVAVAMGVGAAVLSRHVGDLEARRADLDAREANLQARESDLDAAMKPSGRKAPAQKVPRPKDAG